MLCAFTGPVKAHGVQENDSISKATSFKLDPSTIEKLEVGESRTLSIIVEPEGAPMPDITPTIPNDDKNYVECNKQENGSFNIVAKKASDRPVIITFNAEGLDDHTMTIQKIENKESSISVEINENPLNNRWKSMKGNEYTTAAMKQGGIGTDFRTTPAVLSSDITWDPKTAINIKDKGNGLWHIEAKQQATNVTIIIKYNDIKKTIKIPSIIQGNNNQTSGGSKPDTDTNVKITQLEQRVATLQNDSTNMNKTIDSLERRISGLTEDNKSLTRILEESEYDSGKDNFYAIIFSIVGTLIVAIIVLVLLYKRIKTTFQDDLDEANEKIRELKSGYRTNEQLQANNNNGKVKELEEQNKKLKKDNDDLRFELLKLQQKTSQPEPGNNNAPDEGGQPFPPVKPEMPQIINLYSDCIVDGLFNRVTEHPDDDTVYELVLDDDNNASVVIYSRAERRIIANPAFIDGCEKQIVGNSSVNVEQKGVAAKDDNGRWRLVVAPIIAIR